MKKYDSWTWERWSRHALYWAAWSVFFITVNSLIDDMHTVGQWAAFECAVLPIKIASTYLIAYGLMPRFLYKKQYGTFFAAMIGVAALFSVLLFINYAYLVQPIILGITEPYYVGKYVYKGVELVYIASLVMAVKFFQNYLHEQQRNQILAQQKVEAELKYLKNQIQPHFLFNTLNNIYGMVLSNDKNAGDYIVKLSELLSYMLYDSNTETIALTKEVEMLDTFIELERLRYERKLDFEYEKTNLSPVLKIAPLLLIPLVENAFKHGPAKEDGQSFIDIQLETQHDIFYFSVENSYSNQADLTNIQSGIGLENIRKRLELLYPNNHTLSIEKG
ncbi:MAG: sensor histidine kinase, partial [Saprospiraceae bacterium]